MKLGQLVRRLQDKVPDENLRKKLEIKYTDMIDYKLVDEYCI